MTKLKIPGGTLSHGQLHTRPERALRSAPPGFGRRFGEKDLKAPAIAHGMKRVTTGDVHPYLHGQAVNDEAMQKNWEGKGAPIHPAMTPKQVADSVTAPTAKAILEEAGRLGAPVGGWRK